MRNLQMNISTVGKAIVRQSKQLVVRVEVLRSLGANSLSALDFYASQLALALGDCIWQGLCETRVKPRVAAVSCFAPAMAAVANQHQRRHQIMCHRTAA